MGKPFYKNLMGILLGVFFAALISSVTLFAVNFACNKTEKPVPFSEKLVINLGEASSATAGERVYDSNSTSAAYDGQTGVVGVTLQYAETFSCNHGDIKDDAEISAHRAELRAYYKSRNEKLIEELNLSDSVRVSYSYYGPFIEYRYNSSEDFFAHDCSVIESRDGVYLEKVFVEDCDYHDDASRNTSTGDVYSFTTALAHIGIDEKEFTGKGVKIGIIEDGIPSDLSNLTGVTYETFGTAKTSHSFHTSSIIGANSGIATDSELYFASLTSGYTFVECGNWLVEKGVTLINRSNGGNSGTYTATSAYADYLVREHKITFVNSAGNSYAATQNVIGYPSTGLNVICVASNDSNKALSSFSQAGMQPGQTISLAKPTLTAPGGRIAYIPNISSYLSGTSFSAPMVTGLVALLMEEFPELKYHPEKVMSLLVNSCTPALGQTDIWDFDAGFGIVNYKLARESYINTVGFSTPAEASSAQTLLCEREISVPFGGSLTARATVNFNSKQTSVSSLLPVAYSDLRLSLLDAKTGDVVCNGETKSNIAFFDYVNETYYNDDWTTDFKIRISLKSDKTFAEEESGALSFRIEEADEPFGLAFSGGKYFIDGDAVDSDFYFEVVDAGYEIDKLWVSVPDGNGFEDYQDKMVIPLGSFAGDYIFYFEYYDEDGDLENSPEITICLNAVNVQIFRDGKQVYDGTILGSDPIVDSELVLYWGETIKISVNYDDCSFYLDEDILITREEYEGYKDDDFEITFPFYNGEELTLLVRITYQRPSIAWGGKSYGDGETVNADKDVVINWSMYDEGGGAYIRVTDGAAFEEYIELPSEQTEITLPATVGEPAVYTVELFDEFGNTVTITVIAEIEPANTFVIIFIVALIVVVVLVTTVSILVYRKKRQKKN